MKRKYHKEVREHKDLVDAALLSVVSFDYDAYKQQLDGDAAAADANADGADDAGIGAPTTEV